MFTVVQGTKTETELLQNYDSNIWSLCLTNIQVFGGCITVYIAYSWFLMQKSVPILFKKKFIMK